MGIYERGLVPLGGGDMSFSRWIKIHIPEDEVKTKGGEKMTSLGELLKTKQRGNRIEHWVKKKGVVKHTIRNIGGIGGLSVTLENAFNDEFNAKVAQQQLQQLYQQQPYFYTTSTSGTGLTGTTLTGTTMIKRMIKSSC